MNINEIARLAGVSRATVSRYLNNGYVSSEKKEVIRRVIQETGYQPILPGTDTADQKNQSHRCHPSKDQFRYHKP